MSDSVRRFTGWHFLFIMCGAFGTIIAANLTLAYFAVGSFPGLEVINTYVESQQFDRKRRAQEALGWTSTVSYQAGAISVSLKGQHDTPPAPASVVIRVGSATSNREDQTVIPQVIDGHYVAKLTLTAGNKTVFVEALAADGTAFRQRHTVIVR